MRKDHIVICFVFVVALFACNKDDGEKGGSSVETPLEYPVEIGNYWKYDRLIRLESQDSIFNLPDSVHNSIHVEVKGNYLLNDTLNTYEFVEYLSYDNSNVTINMTYFTNENNGFYYHGNRGGSLSLPVKGAIGVGFNGLQFDNIAEFFSSLTGSDIILDSFNNKTDTIYPGDSICIEEFPVKSLSYPLSVGSEWVYREESIIGKISKKVIAKKTISLPIGSFECYEVMMIYENPDYNEDILWFDYYSDKGLIQRNVSIFNLEFTDETGSVIGTGNSFDEINLSEYFVK